MADVTFLYNMDLGDLIYTLSQGNPGAMTVLISIMRDRTFILAERVCISLYKNDIMGPKIWESYKDDHGEDLDAFIQTHLRS